ncbi:MAG TPA: formate/nitrite transporter family protein [Gemmatimonadaceae bacterium]|nr:formate/nitrite transporter family protein [Gemmatimonadaceae bacterium]
MTAPEREESGGPQVGTRYSADEIHENILRAADEEMLRPASSLVWSSLGSGLLIGFSFLAVTFLARFFPPAMREIAAALGYPLGFIFVVLGRHQLFTENTLEPVIPVLQRHDAQTFGRLMRLWGIVLPVNLIGALLFALVLAHTEVVKTSMRQPLLEVARSATEGGIGLVLYKAIWAGWLIALMAWLIASTRETMAQLVMVFLTTAPIAAFGFKHSIAGAVEAFYLAAVGGASWGDMLLRFELPAVIGNIIGGVVLVALLNHGQVHSEG